MVQPEPGEGATEQVAALLAERRDRERLLELARSANENLLLSALSAAEAAEEARLARARMAASEERFRVLVMTSAAIVWRADRTGWTWVDGESWQSFTGEPLPEPPGWSWLALVHPDDRAAVRATCEQALGSGGLYRSEHRLRRADGTYAWVAACGAPLIRDKGADEWVGMLTDITDRKLIEEAREQFIGMLGHDLRTPLGAIQLAAGLLARAPDLPEHHFGVVARLSRSAVRMEGIISDVLDFARGRLGGGIPAVRAWVDLCILCKDQLAELELRYPRRRIELVCTGNLTGEWDAARLEQVISNLVGNGIVHGLDPIRVEVSDAGDDILIAVENAGPPIAPEVLQRIFQPFRRGERIGTGLGLGLYIVSEIVRAHEGTISVVSAEDLTRVTVRLPRRPRAPAARETNG